MNGLAHSFFCSNSRLLLGGIANDYFAIKMPGSVAKNRHNEGEAHEERQRANQQRRGHNEAPEGHRNRVLPHRLDRSRDRYERVDVSVEEQRKGNDADGERYGGKAETDETTNADQ
jgi:hypothetical protein